MEKKGRGHDRRKNTQQEKKVSEESRKRWKERQRKSPQ